MTERYRPHPAMIVLAILMAVVVVVGISVELIDEGGRSPAITEHSGTLTWVPRGENPDPKMRARYWTMTYPAAYASRVDPGVGVYVKEKRIGFVHASEVDRGTVWVYLWIAPRYEDIAAGITESEPIETPEGPRVQIYKYSKATPPGAGLAVPPTATLS